jgi:hypothetical protein
MFTDDDLNIQGAVDRIDQTTRDRFDALIKTSLDEGREDWQISEAFVIAAFRVLGDIDDVRLRLLYAQHLERVARHVSRKMLEEVVSTRLAEEATAWNTASEPRKE